MTPIYSNVSELLPLFHCSQFSFTDSISVLDFPYCVVHELPELTAESLVSLHSCMTVAWMSKVEFKSFLMWDILSFTGSRRQQSVLLEESFFLY